MAVSYQFSLHDLGAISAMELVAMTDQDMFPLMDAIGRILVAGAVERIGVSNLDPDGAPWPQSLRAKEHGGPTLHDSGRLMQSITSTPESHEVTVGSNLPYAGVHQGGATIRPKTAGGLHFTLANGERVTVGQVTIPQRRYLGISAGEADDIRDVTRSFFASLLGGGVQ